MVLFQSEHNYTACLAGPVQCVNAQARAGRALHMYWPNHEDDKPSSEEAPVTMKRPRKILLDCGANVASSVQLFRETYPDGQDFIIHSFEIDERLAPFFAPYPNHVLHCPTGVSNKDVGMNVKAAHKLVETIAAHSSRMPVTLFLYGDFVETFPELVTEWAKTFTIGMRESQPFPLGQFTMQASPWIRTGLVSAIERLREVDIQTAYYLPEKVTDTVRNEAKSLGLRIIQPTARFPPTDEKWLLTVANYFKNRDVERVPKALRVITQQLDNKGGIVSLDSDHPDSYMSSVFLMDYLVEKSGYNLVSIVGCLE
uniref:Uncharacterized protein n=1 Tax=Branchiostoma floridae TaxID=7739 RepID=C3Y9W9_BRAFL|eukprot:XP_002606868.1 hypothetical protein BRAFLDRAFT_91637 [Branchiostoma floridae]